MATSHARRLYQRNPKLTSAQIARAVGRSRQAIDGYIADLRAAIEMALDLKLFRMDRLGVPQERIEQRIGLSQSKIGTHLSRMPEIANGINTDLTRGFTPEKVAEKHGWPLPLVLAIALDNKTDQERFEALKWGLRTWDTWGFGDVDKRFGDDWPGRIPAQLVAHALYYFTKQGDLVFDPMAGGGVVPDVCLALNRRCWSFDSNDRPDTRPEIEPFTWNLAELAWPCNGKSKPDLIFFDPPYFDKKDAEYQDKANGSISSLSRADYLAFFASFFDVARTNVKKTTRMAFLNADWRNFQGTPALEEDPSSAITILDYARILDGSGWEITHLIDCPLSTERFPASIVAAMQNRRILGIVRRTLIMARQRG